MAKNQVYVKEIDGVVREQTAYTPADAVRLVFNGWVEKGTATPVKDTKASASAAPGRDRPAVG